MKNHCRQCKQVTEHSVAEQYMDKIKLICDNCGFKDENWYNLSYIKQGVR